MTDLEYDVIDELYFVTEFLELAQKLSLSREALGSVLRVLVEKGWVKCLRGVSEEISFDEEDFLQNFSNYFYLATKAGLLAHNSIA